MFWKVTFMPLPNEQTKGLIKKKKKLWCETKLIFRALALRQNELRISGWRVVHTLDICKEEDMSVVKTWQCEK